VQADDLVARAVRVLHRLLADAILDVVVERSGLVSLRLVAGEEPLLVVELDELVFEPLVELLTHVAREPSLPLTVAVLTGEGAGVRVPLERLHHRLVVRLDGVAGEVPCDSVAASFAALALGGSAAVFGVGRLGAWLVIGALGRRRGLLGGGNRCGHLLRFLSSRPGRNSGSPRDERGFLRL
jgi:hypothetical protein